MKEHYDQREELYAARLEEKNRQPSEIAISATSQALKLSLQNKKMREALEAIADGEGVADVIARQTLTELAACYGLPPA